MEHINVLERLIENRTKQLATNPTERLLEETMDILCVLDLDDEAMVKALILLKRANPSYFVNTAPHLISFQKIVRRLGGYIMANSDKIEALKSKSYEEIMSSLTKHNSRIGENK